MPQLDIFAYPSQIFWLYIVLFLTYLILFKYVLPEVLLAGKIRARILNDLLNQVKKSEKDFLALLVKTRNASVDSLPQIQTVLSENKKKIEFTSTFKNGAFNSFVQKIRNESKLAFLTEELEKIYFPFIAMLKPSDDLILTMSFLVVFFGLYLYGTTIAQIFDQRSNEIKAKFIDLVSLNDKHLNELAALHIVLSSTEEDKKDLILSILLSLDKQNTANNLSYQIYKFGNYVNNLAVSETSHLSVETTNLYNSYFSLEDLVLDADNDETEDDEFESGIILSLDEEKDIEVGPDTKGFLSLLIRENSY